ncbi:MAG: protein kinase [Tannerella sp.]|nr:protein kinase [Tannerella sp.]
MNVVAQRCDFRPGDCIDHTYYVEKSLGEGSFGKVFKVTKGDESTYALKLLKLWEVHPEIRQQLVDRFDMEFKTGQIPSRYLVQAVNYGFVEGNPYIVMEYCPNGDLMQLVAHSRPDLSRIGRHILYGLRDLHGCGKVHRDLKPENVLIKDDGTAVLTDFGTSGDRNKRMTERNILGKPTQIFGTYAYMPPEQVAPKRGDATVLPTTDIFSYGVMMYQLITGELPFGKLEDANDLVLYIRRGREGDWNKQILHHSTAGTVFQRVIEGCLIPDFKSRLQTVDAVLSLFPGDDHSVYEPAADGEGACQCEAVNGILLKVMHGEAYGTVYKLNDLLQDGKRMLTMGRRESGVFNSIAVQELHSCYISRRHCTLEWDSDSHVWYIRDGQWDKNATDGWRCSLNGTYVNSTQAPVEGISLRPGDIVSIGDTTLRVEGY